ncbi:MAG: hypothetical protein U1E62_15035 [Alsobacter sp.]
MYTLTLSGRQHAVYWADERAVCILGEQHIRDAIEAGSDVVIEVDGPQSADAERVRSYLMDVVQDARAVIVTGV